VKIGSGVLNCRKKKKKGKKAMLPSPNFFDGKVKNLLRSSKEKRLAGGGSVQKGLGGKITRKKDTKYETKKGAKAVPPMGGMPTNKKEEVDEEVSFGGPKKRKSAHGYGGKGTFLLPKKNCTHERRKKEIRKSVTMRDRAERGIERKKRLTLWPEGKRNRRERGTLAFKITTNLHARDAKKKKVGRDRFIGGAWKEKKKKGGCSTDSYYLIQGGKEDLERGPKLRGKDFL